jgi:hypothetical protein
VLAPHSREHFNKNVKQYRIFYVVNGSKNEKTCENDNEKGNKSNRLEILYQWFIGDARNLVMVETYFLYVVIMKI